MDEMQPEPMSAPTGPSVEERQWAMACHLSAFATFVLPMIGHLVGPIIVWVLRKDRMPYVDLHGKEAINFQITCTIYMVICIVTLFILIGVLLSIALGLFWLIFTIIGGIKAYNNEPFRYPATIRFIK